MATSLDVGQYVYSKLGWVDAWKLEKLTYYAQAWHLAWSGRRLVDDSFQAWADGPVAPKLHQVNKFDRTSPTTLPGADIGALSDEAKAAIDAVLAFYGPMSREELIERTHSESPWLNARGGLPEGAWCKREIAVADMRRCYTKMALRSEDVPTLSTVSPMRDTAMCESHSARVRRGMDRWSEALALLAER